MSTSVVVRGVLLGLLCLGSAIGCGDDDGGSTVDASATADSATTDAPPSLADANSATDGGSDAGEPADGSVTDANTTSDGSIADAASPDALSIDAIPADASTAPDALPSRAPAAGELVIVEIHGNPVTVLDDNAEYIEVLNVSSSRLNLEGVTIAYVDWAGGEPTNSTQTWKIDKAVLVEAGARALLVRSTDTGLNGGVAADVDYGNILISNGTTLSFRLRLYVPTWAGTEPPAAADLIDDVHVASDVVTDTNRGLTWQLDPVKVPTPTATANDTASNWCLTATTPGLEFGTGNYGTPGAANACQ